jgi:hypothetical protein
VSRWTKKEQAGYRFETLMLSTDKASGSVLGGLSMGLGSPGSGALSSPSGTSGGGPRIQLELEFLPYW